MESRVGEREDLAGQPRASGARAERLAIGGMTAVFCIANFAVSTVRSVIDQADLLKVSAARGVSYVFACLLCAAIAYVMRRTETWRVPWRALVGFVTVVVAADGFAWVNALAFAAVDELPQHVSVSLQIFNIVYWVWFFAAWTGAYLAVRYGFATARQERDRRSLERLAQAARLRALKQQISPHFLFNTLNSLSALVLDKRNDDAEAMLGNLSEFYRASLLTELQDDVTLDQEIRLQNLYLAVERVRFPDLTVALDVAPALLDALVPPLILQPLVENSIKHAVARTEEPVDINIRARSIEDTLTLIVEDNGPGIASTVVGTGTGLTNVEQRLRLRFGDQGRCVVEQLSPGHRVTLSLPLRWPQ